jgi:hypothetical protein
MADLRSALEKIVNGKEIGICDHPFAIARLSAQFPHSIEHMKDLGDRPYNCFMLAFDLLDNDCVYEILQEDADCLGQFGVTVGLEFASRAIQRGVLVKDNAGQVVIYFRQGRPVHAGIAIGDRIRSKWGIGQQWVHELWEVPALYGEQTKRYAIARPDLWAAEFESYYAELVAAKGGFEGR